MSSTQIYSDIMALNPTAFYPLNETSGSTVTDYSGNGLNLTVATPSSITMGVPGITNDGSSAYQFTATSSQVAGTGEDISGDANTTILAIVKGTYSSSGWHSIACVPYYTCLGVAGGHFGYLEPLYSGGAGAVDTQDTLADGSTHLLAMEMWNTGADNCRVSLDGGPYVRFSTNCGYNQGTTGFEIGASTMGHYSIPGFVGTVQDVAVWANYKSSSGVILTVPQLCKLANDAGIGSTSCPTPAPTPTPTPSPSNLYSSPLSGSDYDVYAFSASANGNATPLYEFGNSYPTFSNPTDLATAPNGNLVLTAEGSNNIVIFPSNANGMTTPVATITNALFNCPWSVGIDNGGNIYVLQGCANFWSQAAVMKFAPSANGNVSSLTEIPTNPSATDGSLVYPKDVAVTATGTIYVANDYRNGSAYTGDIAIFNTNANGSASPGSAIQGDATNMGSPGGVALDGQGDVYVLTKDDGQDPWPFLNSTGSVAPVNVRIQVYPANTSGNVAPSATIEGSATMLSNPIKMRVDPNGGIYVADLGVGGILYFAPGASGNVAPTRIIYGSSTDLGINNVEFVGL